VLYVQPMTTVSIYDDIDPVIKHEAGAPVSLYDELDIPSNTNANDTKEQHVSGPPNPTTSDVYPSMTTTSTVSQGVSISAANPTPTTSTIGAVAPNLIKPNLPPPASLLPASIMPHPNHPPPPHMYPPLDDHVDPSLTGVPLQHLATYRSHVLYVGALTWWVTDADIRRTFDQFGTIVDVKIHADKVNGKSKGYAYVEFDPRELDAAMIAKQKLHGHILNDCRICVAFASPERIKGAEYTNTPVHIPRPKMPNPALASLSSNRYNHRGGNSSASSLFPKIPGFAGPATVIPSAGVLPGAVAAAMTARNHSMPGNDNRSHHAVSNVLGSVLKTGNPDSHASNTNTSTSNVPNTSLSSAHPSNSNISILSKFTDQAQLLALLNKTNNRNHSASRSDGSGSRSRSRSRSRSKHRRRGHRSRKKSSRRHNGGEERNRDRDRERERRRERHRGDAASGSRERHRRRRGSAAVDGAVNNEENEAVAETAGNGNNGERERERDREKRRHRRKHRDREREKDRNESRSSSHYREKERGHRKRKEHKSDNSTSENNTDGIPTTTTSTAKVPMEQNEEEE